MSKPCTECGQAAARLRRDRCDACYMRLYRGGDVPDGAMCGGCGERRRDLLCLETVGGGDAVVCGNCALVLRRVRPRLTTVAELARRRARERRAGTAAGPGPGPEQSRRTVDQGAAVERKDFDVSVD